MLTKSQRLRQDHFKDLQASRRSFHTEHFLLRSTESPIGPKVGVSVSKKVARQANVRNRTRRRAYSEIAKFVGSLDKKLYLVVAKAGADRLKGVILAEELALLFKKG